MDVSAILQQLKIPKNCLIDRVVPKKTIFEHATSKQKKVIQSQLKRLRWMYALKTEKTNIPSFRDELFYFPEIEYFIAEIDQQQSIKELATIVMQLIPYPMVLFFTWENQFCIMAVQYRVSQKDPSKIVVQKLIQSKNYSLVISPGEMDSFIQKQLFSNQSLTNFKAYYDSVVSKILQDKLESAYMIKLPLTVNLVTLNDQLEKLETEINDKQIKMKKVDQFNHRVELQVEVHELMKQKNDFLKKYEIQE